MQHAAAGREDEQRDQHDSNVICVSDVRKDRERRNPSAQQHQQQQQQQQGSQQIPRGPGSHQPQYPTQQGIPTGSYRDANGIPRSIARDQPLAASYRADGSGAGSGGAPGGGEYGTSYTNRKTKEHELLSDIVKQTRQNFIDVSQGMAAAGGAGGRHAAHTALDEEDLVERGNKYVRHLSELPAYITLGSVPNPGPAGGINAAAGTLGGAQWHPSSAVAAHALSPHMFGRYYNSQALPLPSSIVVKRAALPAHASALSAGLAAQSHGHPAAASSSSSSSSSSAGAVVDTDYGALLQLLRTAHVAQQDAEFIVSASSQLSALMTEGSIVEEPAPKIVLTFEELLNK